MQRFWQVLIGLLILIGLAFTTLTLAELAQNRDGGDFGFSETIIRGNERLIQSVTPNSPAARAGLKPGDRIFLTRTFADRVALTATAQGDVLDFAVSRPNGRRVRIVADQGAPPPVALLVVVMLTRIAFLAVAALLALRASDRPAGRNLAMFLACFGASMSIDSSLLPALWLRFTTFLVQEGLFLAGVCAALRFAMQFPRTSYDWQRGILRATPAVFVGGLILSSSQLGLQFFSNADRAQHAFIAIYATLFVSLAALTCVGFIANFRAATGAERVRMRWVLLTFVFGFAGVVASLALVVIVGIANPWTQYVGLTIVAMPFGLAYVILRHRLLDIGFVVNRALVYTGVSVVVVGSFIVFEWLLGHVLDERSRASAILQLGGALALGLSVRYIHGRVDHYVDDFFFRERHAAEHAVRRFAHEALLVTDASELVTKAVETAQRHMRLSGCAFYTRFDGTYRAIASTFASAPPVSENDYAVLQMRTWHGSAELHESRTSLPGELAIPMIVRAELSGFLLCGEKITNEAFAPDEREALALLARDAGIALDSLRTRAIEQYAAALARDPALPAEARARIEELTRPAQPAGDGLRSSQGMPLQGVNREPS